MEEPACGWVGMPTAQFTIFFSQTHFINTRRRTTATPGEG
jgi:hypothetical protein